MNSKIEELLNAPPIYIDSEPDNRRIYTTDEVFQLFIKKESPRTYNSDGSLQCLGCKFRSIQDFAITLKTCCGLTNEETIRQIARLIHEEKFMFLWCNNVSKPTFRKNLSSFWTYANRYVAMTNPDLYGSGKMAYCPLIQEVTKYLPKTLKNL